MKSLWHLNSAVVANNAIMPYLVTTLSRAARFSYCIHESGALGSKSSPSAQRAKQFHEIALGFPVHAPSRQLVFKGPVPSHLEGQGLYRQHHLEGFVVSALSSSGVDLDGKQLAINPKCVLPRIWAIGSHKFWLTLPPTNSA